MPNQKETLPRFQDLTKVNGVMRDGKVYAIPYAFDSIGLIYDTDKVKEAPTSWNVLWDPKYTGKVLGYDNGEHNFSFTALTMGIDDPFHLTDDQLQAGQGQADRPQAAMSSASTRPPTRRCSSTSTTTSPSSGPITASSR